MAVEADMDQAHRLVLPQIFERVRVDVVVALGLTAQNPIVDEVAPGKGDYVAARRRLLARQADVQGIAIPAYALLAQEIERVGGPAIGRRGPALGTDAGGL